jgi:hypothetical protein
MTNKLRAYDDFCERVYELAELTGRSADETESRLISSGAPWRQNILDWT